MKMKKIDKGIMNFSIRTIASYALTICAVFILSVSAAQAATFTVSNLNDSGTGSLRDAITQANTTAGFDTITFTTGAGTINLLTPLPAITDQVFIDGGATPTIELNGLATQSAGASSIGFYLRAGGSTIKGFIINRFGEAGIRMDTDGVGVDNGNAIFNNRIGTNAAGDSLTCGTSSCGNLNRGILVVGTTGHVIGTGTAAARNLISGNSGRGIDINAGGSASINGNFIGTNAAGTGDLGNLSHGISIVNSSGSSIGQSGRNIISGNNGSGIFISGDIGTPASNNVVTSNYIGTDVGGDTALGNNGSGVVVMDANNTIGGSGALRNIISGNNFNGVSISGSLATGNVVQGNFIGVGASGTSSVPNRESGVQISNQAFGNTVGGTGVTIGACDGVCNTIANNGDPDSQSARAGIYLDITAGVSNTLRGNSIFNNAGLGIDLGAPGATANDAMDPDTGANNQQNSPVLNSANNAGIIGGTLNSTPNTTFAIEFFRNATPDTAVTSEARTFIGSTSVTTDSGGNATFSFSSGASTLTTGQFVTATATSTAGAAQAIGDTSEISNIQAVVATTGGVGGFEADIAPRPNGDGVVQSNDVVQIRSFLTSNCNTINTTTNEFQRADSAPFASKGDGLLASNDVVQARRYVNNSDAPQLAGGPTAPNGGCAGAMAAMMSGSETKASGGSSRVSGIAAPKIDRQVRVESTSAASPSTVTVNIRVDANGDESEYAFIVNYQAPLSNPVVGNGTAGSLLRDCNIATAGQVNCSVGGFPTNNPASGNAGIGEIGAGTNQLLITITFNVAAGATPGSTTPLSLTNVNASNDAAALVSITGMGGLVSITGPTAAEASIAGRVRNSSGAGIGGVQMTLLETQSGASRTTMTAADGGYRFEGLEVGGDYIITPKYGGYSFSPGSKQFSLIEDLAEVDFVVTKKRTVRAFR
jgi:hypothetical protein